MKRQTAKRERHETVHAVRFQPHGSQFASSPPTLNFRGFPFIHIFDKKFPPTRKSYYIFLSTLNENKTKQKTKQKTNTQKLLE